MEPIITMNENDIRRLEAILMDETRGSERVRVFFMIIAMHDRLTDKEIDDLLSFDPELRSLFRAIKVPKYELSRSEV